MNAPARLPDAVVDTPLVALIGNPNTGKTTLFNELTGARARVGNYPGITVERKVGTMRLGDRAVDLVDLPGSYSLSARSREEQIAIEAVLGLGRNPPPRLCIVVVDASQVVRNLYLALQLIELQVPLVVAINMIDEVDEPIDTDTLGAALGVPCVPISARRREGLERLREVVEEGLGAPPRGAVAVDYPEALTPHLEAVAATVPEAWVGDIDAEAAESRRRALASWALTSIDEDDELHDVPMELREAALAAASDYDVDLAIVTARYRFLDDRVGAALLADARSEVVSWTDRVDRVLLHPVGGFAVFVVIMVVLFQSLFSWADPAIGLVETLFSWLGQQAQTHLPEGFVADLVSQGIVGGVGNVVVFLPQIILLFLLLGFLEDSGYMARAAYLMDRVMKSLGLHGRAFVPMISGCACAIPAIMATRTMERHRDRLLTMLVVPLMTCSARLPVYTLIIAALFPPGTVLGFVPTQGLMMVGMYLFATFVTLAAAGVLGRTVVKGRRMPLLLELPPYRLPTLKSVLRQAADRALTFLREAGTVILGFTIVLWLALSYPKPDAPPPEEPVAAAAQGVEASAPSSPSDDAATPADPDAERAARELEASFGGQLGRAVEPVVRPLGFDWKLTVAIIGAFSAREVFVSTLGLIYGIGADADEESAPLRTQLQQAKRPDGSPVYTPLVGLSLMVFFALACQCMSTLAVVRRETQSWKWPAFLFTYMTALAYLASLLVYQGGRLLGFA